MPKKKKILLVSSAFLPEISPRSFRATELAREFYRQGNEVVVISKYREHDYDNAFKDSDLTFKMWGRSKLPKVPNVESKPFSFLSRAISRILLALFEYPGIEEMFQVKRILKIETGYDLIISFAVPYPVHWGVAWARTKNHRIARTWVADCGDPYMGDVLDSFRKLFYFKYLEKWFCRKADFISIPIQGALPAYYPEFHDKIRIIPQGFNFDLNTGSKEPPVNEIPSFAYAGGFLPGARDPRKLLDFLKNLGEPFRFLIFTNNAEMLNEYRSILKEKLIISDYIPRERLLQELSKMDFLLNFDNNTTRNAPSKLIDYSIVNRPVLNITTDFRTDIFLSFLKRDYRERMILPDIEQYHIRNVADKFLNI